VRHTIESEIERQVRDAVSFAEQSSMPALSELKTHVFA
jgi:TPP-dependent pyruvate/acetoin dehydrogenase alpha subunit